MTMTDEDTGVQGESDFPKISQPALRALNGAGYFSLEQLTRVSKTDLSKLYGMGPKALGVLEATLAEKGLAFKRGESR